MSGGGSAVFGSFTEFLGQENPFFQFGKMDGKGAGGGSAATFGETQAYADIMAYFAEPASSEPDFSKFDFSGYGHDDPPAFWIFDKKGEELMNHWLGGSGKNLNFSYDKSWSDYMSSNKFYRKGYKE